MRAVRSAGVGAGLVPARWRATTRVAPTSPCRRNTRGRIREVEIETLGLVDYEEALDLQTRTLESLSRGAGPERVFLLEHPHVFTVGRRWRGSAHGPTRGPHGWVRTVPTSRGGDITYHGPGQLVGYPILDLHRRGRDLHLYLRKLEECLIRTVRDFGLDAHRREGLTGAWTSEGKLASIGIAVKKWITMHGFALNVATDLRYFEGIDPCGIPECPVTSMSHLLKRAISIEEVLPVLSRHLTQVLRPVEATRLAGREESRNQENRKSKVAEISA